jgi:hypothetical protein
MTTDKDIFANAARTIHYTLGVSDHTPAELNDVHIEVFESHVLVTFDGAGHDWLSYERRSSAPLRESLTEALDAHGMYISDVNTWSFNVYLV